MKRVLDFQAQILDGKLLCEDEICNSHELLKLHIFASSVISSILMRRFYGEREVVLLHVLKRLWKHILFLHR